MRANRRAGVVSLAEAVAWMVAHVPALGAERVRLDAAYGRVLAEDLTATALPAQAVAAIDGHAVRAADTEGASEYNPLPIGGREVVAGGLLPPGTDAVLPYPAVDAGPAAIAAVARGSGVLGPGHDAAEGWTLPAGTRLTPLHVALLARLGRATVVVVRRPRVALAGAAPEGGPERGADALTALLHGLVAGQSAQVVEGVADIRLLAGRSGAGPGPGPGPDDDGVPAFTTLFAHGIAIRPGESTAVGAIDGTLAILLPGHALACATTFALLVAPVLRHMGGLPEPARLSARLSRKIASSLGRCDAVRVRLEDGVATPLGPADGGGLALGLAADGLVLAPEGSEGYPAGAIVSVLPL